MRLRTPTLTHPHTHARVRAQLKVADFGLAAIKVDPNTLCSTCVGTKSYMAPEVLSLSVCVCV